VLYPTLGALSEHIAELVQKQALAHAQPAPSAASQPSTALHPRHEQRISIAGQDHCVSTWGDPSARPVLCLHGYNDQGPIWDAVAQRLVARGCYVIAPDLRGHGLSAHAPDGRGSDLYGFVNDVTALTDALALRDVTLVGHSLGAMIAITWAAQHPERLQRLCLVEPVLPAASAPVLTPQLASEPVARGLSHKPRLLASEAEALQIFAAFHPNMERAMQKTLTQRLLTRTPQGLMWRTDPNAIGAGRWPRRDEYIAQLQTIAVPAGIVFGEDSELVPPQAVEEIASALDSPRVLAIAGGHWIHHEAPEPVAALIAELATGVARA
jgi:pimeloyl-ACP methyl ester carboxylesterase